jgi:hypothetical protein
MKGNLSHLCCSPIRILRHLGLFRRKYDSDEFTLCKTSELLTKRSIIDLSLLSLDELKNHYRFRK